VTPAKVSPFAHISDSELLSYGVPPAWLEEVRLANEDTILAVAAHLPAEAADAVLELAVGAKPKPAIKLPAGANPFEHPDAQRRFRVMRNVDELEAALSFPWEKWSIFLHPAQRDLVERDFNGPARVSGSAGTGKSIVAVHRAANLARRNPGCRVLLTTFSTTLAKSLDAKLRTLLFHEPRLAERIDVESLDAIAIRLWDRRLPRPAIADNRQIAALLPAGKFPTHFLVSEWENVVDAWQLESWEAYRDVVRLGRRARLNESQRAALWPVFQNLRTQLQSQGLTTRSAIFADLAAKFAKTPGPYDFVIVDEAQDIGVAQLRFIAALASAKKNGLFFAGDLGQRIFQQPFSWKALGADVRGRSHTLKINYRTSHQIRRQADKLLGAEVSDVDGNREERAGTISVFNGPAPAVETVSSPEKECTRVAAWLKDRLVEGVLPMEIGIFVRSSAEIPRAKAAAESAKLPFAILDENVEPSETQASISTMHLAKGLEFRAVAVMACDDEVIPLQHRIETAADSSELEDVYATERHLLYVACTRARDYLLVTGVKPSSEFLDDLSVPAR
jgi:superfamily I DNA/RNA helicase